MFKKDTFKWDKLLLKHSKKLIVIQWKFKEVFDEIEDYLTEQIEVFCSANSNVNINFDIITERVFSKINIQNTEEKKAYELFYNENNRYGHKGELSVGEIFEIRCLFRKQNWFVEQSMEKSKIAILFYFELQCELEMVVPDLFELSVRYTDLAQLNEISLLNAILLSKGCIF